MFTFGELKSEVLCNLFGDYLSSVNRLDHHLNGPQGVWPASVLSPENSILVLASIMASSVPYSIEVRVCTGVVPPASFMKVRTVSCRRNTDTEVKFFCIWHFASCRERVLPLEWFEWRTPDWFQSCSSWSLTSLELPYSFQFLPTLHLCTFHFLPSRVNKMQCLCVRSIRRERREKQID